MNHFVKVQENGYDDTNWQKTKTTRRYVHPPRSERMFTLWAEGRILFGDVIDGTDVEDKKNGHEYYDDLVSCGIWMLQGKEKEQFDFTKVENVITQSGVPIHGVKFTTDDVEVYEETFCNTERKTSCYIKVTVANKGDKETNTDLSFMLRTGKEKQLLTSGDSDQYADYEPDVNKWKKDHPATWKMDDGVFTDSERKLYVLEGKEFDWCEKCGCIQYNINLKPQESKEIIFVLNKGEGFEKDYDKAKEETKAFWEKELSRLNKLPQNWYKDEEKMKMLRHWTAQLLQCMAYSVDKDYLLFRQGGLQRIVWPGEVNVCFEAMAQIGDFSDYLEDTLDTYFNVMQVESGEVINIGIYWACVTGTVLYSLAKYCMHMGEKGEKCYQKYRDQAFKAFEWIRATRNSTKGIENIGQGFFPDKRSCDWVQTFQAWQTTDIYTIWGIEAFAEITKFFDDERAKEAEKEYNDYMETFRKYIRPFADKAKNSDELYIPLCPLGNDDEFVEGLFPQLGHGEMAAMGFLTKEEAHKLHNGLLNSNRAYKCLYGRMFTSWKRHMWYVSTSEYKWFRAWKRFGETEKMREILDGQFKYAMTEEYTMHERYIEDAPYFSPWSPNASAMGRTILMMLAMEEIDK